MSNTAALIKLILIALLVLGSIIVFSCRSTQTTIKSPDEIQRIAKESMSHFKQCTPNADSSYYLCVADDDPMMDPLRKMYIVYDQQGEVALEKRRVHGSVEWNSVNSIKETIYERVMKKREDKSPARTNIIYIENKTAK